MIRLHLLGFVDLRDDSGGELRSVLAQPKRLGLLAYLAAASPIGPQRRDTLLAVFWPDLDQEHARNALSKAVHFLRRSLGEDAITSRTADELALNEAAVWADVRAFAAALEENRTDEALELYRGDLLPSFFVPEVPGFEDWLERERARLRSRAATAAKALAERHEAGRHLTLALAAARRAVELSDGDERPFRRLVELLDRSGDRAGAVRAYEEFARKLRTELEVEPSAETVALIERIKASPVHSPLPDAGPGGSVISEPAISRLARSVASRYKVERQLGEGAMAVVALAHDLRHNRRVAIKVLRPELSSLMGPERFLREIDIAAGLMHPHILPLHDSGEADGLLYYVMPYVEGESLRGRLEREHRLAVVEALHIGREIADALVYAHHRGFVHRDIKPENILLGGGHALVADFGIARALGSVEQLVSAGGTGTPAYMSPEQVTGESPIDERTDIYALGCVLYEMLSGEPPFAGTTPEETLALRVTHPVRRISLVRDEVGPELENAIHKALARSPADRFSRVSEFAKALDAASIAVRPVESELEQKTPVEHRRPRARANRWSLIGAGVLLLVTALATFRDRNPSEVTARESDPVAVLPFRVAGGDSILSGLGEGVVDLLTTRLSAGAGLRVIDATTALAAWRRSVSPERPELGQQEMVELAGDLGARRVITGSIVRAVSNVTLAASLLGVPDGSVRAQASLTGEADSLIFLVDRLTAELLSLEAGEAEHRLSGLTSTSLPALRQYLEGQASYRRLAFDQARDHFRSALQLDSTFALAAMGLYRSLGWGHTRYTAEFFERTARLAWTYRNRLSLPDQLRLRAQVGAHYPHWTPPGDQLAFLDSAVGIVPYDPELWQEYGHVLFIGGSHLAIPHWRERAAAAFHRAIALDSSSLEARNHLVRLSVVAGDTSALRDLEEYFSRVPFEAAEMVSWLASTVRGDTRSKSLASLGEQTLRRIVIEGTSFGMGLEDADSAVAILLQHSASAAERTRALMMVREFASNRGRPSEALRALRELRGSSRSQHDRQERLRELVYYALYWDGDQTAGELAARELARVGDLPAGSISTEPGRSLRARCVAEQWRIGHQDLSSARQAVSHLRAGAEALGDRREAARARSCASLLEAMVASAERRPNVLHLVDRLDSLHMAALPDLRNEDIWVCAGNLVAAQLRATHGDLVGALAAIRRRGEPGDQKILLSSFLREEGRLAALAADTVGAIRAYRHYLALRAQPEPRLIPQRDSVRAALAELERWGSQVALRRSKVRREGSKSHCFGGCAASQ
ncbi:MAG TPA: protein kinase [Gemmatimonadales bacterium]|nr:protein kinase [Gemmatimonadales bacterium]